LDAEERAYFTLGALLVSALAEPPLLAPGQLAALAERVIHEEAAARTAAGRRPSDREGGWLLWRARTDQRHDVWLSLARQLLLTLQTRPFGEAQEHLRLIAEYLLE
jgi:hypothetical protein